MLGKAVSAAGAILVLLLAGPAGADEGMWTFDQAPLARMRQALGVDLDARWLDHLRAASVRLTSGCSASIVSREGLVLTNQHCLVACLQHLSSSARDLNRDGFAAEGRRQELACPGMEAEVLTSITDATAAIYAAGKGKYGDDWASARQTAIADAEKAACREDPRYRCQLVSFYQGGQFKVYRYRRYADVRLVFAPEFAAAFFGGDPDNFTFPRYDLDCAFLRLYEAGRPADTPEFLRWSAVPPAVGDPVFVSGSPGVTDRRMTVAQLESQRDVALPLLQQQAAALRARLKALAALGPEQARLAAAPLFQTENSLKIFQGRAAALRDPAFLAGRSDEEARLKARLAAYPELAARVGNPWTELQNLQPAFARQFVVWRQLESGAGGGSELFRYARDLVRAAAERAKPAGQRLPEYSDSRLPLIERAILAARPVSPELERLYLQLWLSNTRDLLGADTPAVGMLLGAETPEALSARLVAGSKLADPAVRRALWRGGLDAIKASDDPMIAFVLATDPLSRAARDVWDDDVLGPTELASERMVAARYAMDGASIYPDATSTLRLSYGKVAGLDAGGGEQTGPFTTFAGLYGRVTGEPPYQLPARWTAAQGRLNGASVLDFSTTNDIVGGSSGSPVVDAHGRIVGTAFDGNIHSIAGDFAYDGARNRTIAVSTAAITEALAKVYGRPALVRELEGE